MSPLYDFDCPNNHRFEAFCSKYTESLACRAPGCLQKAHIVFVATHGYNNQFNTEPVVIHRAADGTVRFPGHKNAPVPEGFQKVELTTTHEKRRFEREINQHEYKRWSESQENKERYFEAQRTHNRSELRAMLKDMPQAVKDFAEAAIARRNNKPRPKYESGFHIEALSMDSSNREGYRDSQTDWRSRK